MELGPAQLATRLVGLVLADDGLPRRVREIVEPLRQIADRQPDLAIARLDAAAQQYAAYASYRTPTVQLAKAVTIESFWEHYIDEAVKALFPEPESYRRQLVAAPQPERMAFRDLKAGVLVPASHSWLVPYQDVRRLSGQELITELEMGMGRQPPLLLLVLKKAGLAGMGIELRSPRATDAAAARQTQWRRSGLVSGIEEFIDRDIPASAVAKIEWRP